MQSSDWSGLQRGHLSQRFSHTGKQLHRRNPVLDCSWHLSHLLLLLVGYQPAAAAARGISASCCCCSWDISQLLLLLPVGYQPAAAAARGIQAGRSIAAVGYDRVSHAQVS
jgi:hypothetical protein